MSVAAAARATLGCSSNGNTWKSAVPIICVFNGIVVQMIFYDNKRHSLPHIHVQYGGDDATFKVIDTMLPMNPKVASVRPLPQHRLFVEFSNGERKIFDVTPYLSKGVFVQLREPATFAAVRVTFCSVEWPGEIDLSHDTLYICGTPADDLTSRTVA